jgi:8-hydroxy-5-deazaflavin:NADPH oxidoreductase
LGTGSVGQTIATALIKNGHEVMMGSRSARNEKALAWTGKNGNKASEGSFDDAAAFGEILFLCLNGSGALDAVRSINKKNVNGKTVLDLTNPLDFSKGMPPGILEGLGNTTSLGEEIQKVLSSAHVVKALNTLTAQLMVAPKLVNGGDHNLFICGNDADAKKQVKELLAREFGWMPENLIDLGGIQNARGTEAYVPFWVSIMQARGNPLFNVKIVQ